MGNRTLSERANYLLRLALRKLSAPVRRRFRVKARHMGYRPGLNYDDIEWLLEYGEGGHHA